MTMKLTGKKEFFDKIQEADMPLQHLLIHLYDWTEDLVLEELDGPDVHVQPFISDDKNSGIFALSVHGATPEVVGMDLEIEFDEHGYPDIDCEWEKGLGNDYTTMTSMGENGISVSNALTQITQFIYTYGKDS